jgi:hypothetical protein
MVWGAAPRRVAVVTLPVLLRVLLGTLQHLLPRALPHGELQLAVLRILIHMFLGLPDPDPLVRESG